jgi:hypothetical protein
MPRGSTGVSRRAFLVATGLALAGGRPATGQAPADDAAALRAALAGAGIAAANVRTTASYVAAGDAPEAFLRDALALCEALAADFLGHFRRRGFAVAAPAGRMAVIVLSGPESYAKWTGAPAETAVGGHYDLASNRLVLFDNRGREAAGAEAARANTVALMHEATHGLCFNAGLLERAGDVPKLVSEGLATYGEVRRPDGRTRVGDPNAGRLAVLREGAWIPLESLWRDDAAFDDPAVQQRAYAQAWVLVHTLVQREAWRAKFRAYLDRIRPRRDVASRLEDAAAALGPIAALEESVRSRAGRSGGR